MLSTGAKEIYKGNSSKFVVNNRTLRKTNAKYFTRVEKSVLKWHIIYVHSISNWSELSMYKLKSLNYHGYGHKFVKLHGQSLFSHPLFISSRLMWQQAAFTQAVARWGQCQGLMGSLCLHLYSKVEIYSLVDQFWKHCALLCLFSEFNQRIGN